MFKKVRYFLVLTLLVAFFSVIIVNAQQVSIPTKADLVDSLEDLREAMSKKINCDIDITAQAFTDVKDYWRSKRWADIFTTPLRILEDTLSVLNKITYIKNLSKGTNAALNNSETLYQFLSIVMMYQDLQKVGEKLYWGLNGPNYVASIESMLEEADATFVPPFGDSWQKYYKEAIENYLYGTTEKIPIIIPRRSATAERKNIEFARGAIQVRSRIARTFNDLIKEIKSKELPEDFPIDEVIIQVKELTKQIHKSMSYNTDVEYKTNFQNHVKVKLGAVGEQYRAFGQVAGMVDKKLEIEQSVELLMFIESIENAALLYTTTYKIPGAEEIEITQKATVLSEIIINPYSNTFYSDSEQVFYMLPQEMILSMPTELSNLWMVADDIDQYLRCFYQEIATPIITSPLKITPSSPYYVGDTINAEFTITNKDSIPITLSALTVGGRDPDNQVADFTHRQNITLKPSASYDYKGTLTLNKVGNYHFFCTYQRPDGEWNTCIDLGSGLTDEDRIKNIIVEEKENQAEGPAVSGELFIEWDKTFGGSRNEAAYSIVQTTDGGYALAGGTGTKSGRGWDAWIIKLDCRGNLEWDKTFSYPFIEYARPHSIIQDRDGGYVVVGTLTGYAGGRRAAWIIKLDCRGNLEWDKTFGESGHEEGNSIVQTTDGGYALAGRTLLKGGAGGRCAWIIKLDCRGNLEWDKTFEGSGDAGAYSIVQTTDGGYALAGGIGSGPLQGAWIIKLDCRGNVEWDKTFEGSGYDTAYSIVQITDGGYVAIGYASSRYRYTEFSDTWVIKLNNRGNIEWDKTFEGPKYAWPHSIIQVRDGGYVAIGTPSRNYTEDPGAWVIRLDNRGNLEWNMTFGRSNYDRAHSIIQTTDGGYALAGVITDNGAGLNDFWVIKLKKENIKMLKEKLTINSSLYHIECGKLESWYKSVILPVSVSGPADNLAIMLTNPKGETYIRFILPKSKSLIDTFGTVKLRMGNAPFSEGPYILTVVTPEKIIYKTELWFTAPKDIQITSGKITLRHAIVAGGLHAYLVDKCSLTFKNEYDLPFFLDTPKIVLTMPGRRIFGKLEEKLEFPLDSFITVPSGEFNFNGKTNWPTFRCDGPIDQINAMIRLYKKDKLFITLPMELTIEE